MKNPLRALSCLILSLAGIADAGVDPSPVLRVEYAFAAAAASRGVRDAFLEYAAPGAVLFRPRAVDAREYLEAAPATPGRLEWYPAYAVLAASHDLGFTTGPWVARKEEGGPVVAQGHYVTIWKQQPGGAWRFVVDHGVSHPALEPPPTALSAGTESGSDIKLVAFSDREAALKTLVAANDELDAAMITEGPRVLEERMEPGARVYREGVAPLERTSAIEVALAQAPSRIAAQRIGSDVSEAGDLGYTIGYGRTVTQGSPQDLVYVRIWRRSEGVWRVLLDLETPLPAAGDS